MRRDSGNPWLPHRTFREGASLRLFCFPFAGGAAHVFRPWVTAFPPTIEVCPLQPPGRWTRLKEPPFREMRPMVLSVVDAFQAEFVERPYALFGYSVGALVAFEVAREVRRRGLRAPALLIVGARSAPHLPLPARRLHELGDDALVAGIESLYGALPAAALASPELRALFLGVIRADLEVFERYTYVPEEALDVPLIAMGGVNDPVVDVAGVHAWQRNTNSRFVPHLFPGAHFFAFAESQTAMCETVVRELQNVIESARSNKESL